MTTQHNSIVDRIHELGFNGSYTFTVTNHLVVHGHIWIVNDVVDIHAFAVKDITFDELRANKLWPK